MVVIKIMKLTDKGFTLIELIITMLIVVIVFGILANLVGFSTTFFRDENTQVANQAALRQVAVAFEKDVRRYALDKTMFSVSGTCTTLGSAVTYCHVGQTIERNAVVVANGIQTFKIDYLSNPLKVHLYMLTKLDSRNHPSEIEYDVYYRTDK